MGGIHVAYRPERLEDIWGNAETVRTLQNMFKEESHDQTFLFHGVRGCGKTTTARACANELGILPGNVEEINIADQRGIDDARRLIQGLDFPPIDGKRAYILDECHKANDFWSDALLKSLEEPPEWAYFFLCTTDPQKLKKTIRSRCQEFEFSPLSQRILGVKLGSFIEGNGWDLPDDSIPSILEISGGIPRDALKLVGKLVNADPGDRHTILESTTEDVEAGNLCQALLKKDCKAAMDALAADKAPGAEEKIRRGVMGYMAAIMQRGPGNNDRPSSTFMRANEIFFHFKDPFYNQGWPGLVNAVADAIYRN